MSDLAGKVILVTGAARGIGAAIASACVDAGAEVIGVDRDPVPGGILSDLSQAAAPEAVVAEALDRSGRLDGLVNAAGVTTRASFLDADVARFDQVMAVNLRAPFFLMAGVIAHLRGRDAPGSIVNIQSMNAHCGVPDLAIYAASKGGLQTLTRNAAQTHMADRIRVNGINLGWVATETERAVHGDKGVRWLDGEAARQPLGRFVTDVECAAQAVWMLSDAARPMSGVCLDLEQWIAGAPP
ncbi:oxidoreductase [Jannaschia sp. CCS1]|uniref:oxidoreductase n=1 Tax=Jannaschia sp. (strain CCS1) TaxID=290400 RepID=UPI000053DE59|nr:oxidoreductase [Jannaschia sp. CCS1]ABD54375.1 short-chain dehydrogenase/reductase SDR [Jannaschia sp. CCS1]